MATSTFSGTLKECLQQLQRLPAEHFRNLVEFTGARTKTVSGWLFGEKKNDEWVQLLPAGEWWIKAVGFFLLSGWQVKELEREDEDTSRTVTEAIKLIAYGVMPVNQVVKKIGWSNPNPLFRFAYGTSKTPVPAVNALRGLVENEAGKIDEAESELSQFAIRIDDLSADTAVVTQHDPVERLTQLLKEAAPLVTQLFDDSSDRGEVRLAALRRGLEPQVFTRLTFELGAMKSVTVLASAREQAANAGRRSHG